MKCSNFILQRLHVHGTATVRWRWHSCAGTSTHTATTRFFLFICLALSACGGGFSSELSGSVRFWIHSCVLALFLENPLAGEQWMAAHSAGFTKGRWLSLWARETSPDTSVACVSLNKLAPSTVPPHSMHPSAYGKSVFKVRVSSGAASGSGFHSFCL